MLAGLARLYNARAGTSSGALTLASKRRRSSDSLPGWAWYVTSCLAHSVRKRSLRSDSSARVWVLLGIRVNLLIVGGAFISPLLALAVSGAITGFYTFEQTPIRAKGGSAPCRTRPAT